MSFFSKAFCKCLLTKLNGNVGLRLDSIVSFRLDESLIIKLALLTLPILCSSFLESIILRVVTIDTDFGKFDWATTFLVTYLI